MENLSLIEKLINAAGKNNAVTNEEDLLIAEQTNYATWQKIRLILYPESTQQLNECIKLANEYQQPVYVVSNGKNWGYGSRVPVTNDNILIELKKMNRILDFNEKLGYISIEPGVTFNQLFTFLRSKNSELILSTIGGSSNSSALGNALERGIGTGIYADRFSTVCGMEVLLPNGNFISTGFNKYGNFISGNLYKYGNGPYIDGLFSQSNLGIVTKLTLWLNPAPSFFYFIFYKINNKEKLEKLIDVLQRLLFIGTIRPTITIYNDTRVVTAVIQFPFQQTEPGVIEPELLMRNIRAASDLGKMIGDWNGEISIRCENEQLGEIQSAEIAEIIRPFVDEINIIKVTKAEIFEAWANELASQKKSPAVALKDFLIKKYIGIPDETAMRYCYWRKRKPIPENLDPDKDKCGLIWISPITPFTGEDISNALNIITGTIKKYKFEPAISLQCMSERCINVIASFNWDREIENEETDALICYNETNQLLAEAGYFSYRKTTLQMQQFKNANSNNSFIDLIKKAVDPNNILSPGKYINE